MKILIALTLLTGCQAQRQIEFKSAPDAGEMTLVLSDLERPNSDPEVKGELPVKLAASDLKGKVARIQLNGTPIQHWYFPELNGASNAILIDAAPKASSETARLGEDKMPPSTRNKVVRILLKAYQALTANKPDLAIALAEDAAKIDAQIAGPHLIRSLAAILKGDKAAAELSIQRAKTLDPEDLELEKIAKAVEAK